MGDVYGLSCALSYGCEWDANLCTIATEYGHICVLHYADINAFPIHMEEVLDMANRHMHIPIIKWILTKEYKIYRCKKIITIASTVANVLENQFGIYREKNDLELAEDMIYVSLYIRYQVFLYILGTRISIIGIFF
jgi:hypothetical protein